MISHRKAQTYEWKNGEYTASTDPNRLDIGVVHDFLTKDAYWSLGIGKDMVERAIGGSLSIGLYAPGGAQVGFARIVTDRTLFAYLRDVFVLPRHRGKGLGLWLTRLAIDHPDLSTVKRWMLATSDAQELYAKLGFQPLSRPEFYMQLERSVEAVPGDDKCR